MTRLLSTVLLLAAGLPGQGRIEMVEEDLPGRLLRLGPTPLLRAVDIDDEGEPDLVAGQSGLPTLARPQDRKGGELS